MHAHARRVRPNYETAALLGVFAILLRLRRRIETPGSLFAVYLLLLLLLLLAGITRLLTELVRTNPPIFLGLTEAQWTSIALSTAGAVWLGVHAVVVAPEGKPAARRRR
jgi:prolipoprotein diacylglyceryltransferase